MNRFIIHLNVADFAVAVERVLDRRLADRPVVIAPAGAIRAAVYDMSQEAYLAGIRKGMLLNRALKCCPDARVLPPHPDRYEQAMRTLFKQVLPFSPLVEPGADDGHLFVDVTGTSRLFGPAVDVAWRLGRQIRSDLGLSPIWSVAPNKLLAKVGTRLVKPLGEYIVGSGEETAFLAPLPLWLLPGIEPADLIRFRSLNLTRVGQAMALDPDQLAIPFGKRATFLHDTLRGMDTSPVRPTDATAPKVMAEQIFDTDTNRTSVLEGALYRLVEQAGRALREQCLAARRVGVFLDYADGVRRVRSAVIRPASANDITLFEQVRTVFYSAWSRRVRVRHLRLVCDRLTFPPAQQPLFAHERAADAKRTALVAALDRVRDRFGCEALQVGRTLAA